MLIKLVQSGHIYCFLQFEYTGLLEDTIAAGAVLLYLFEELTLYCLKVFRSSFIFL